MSISTTATLKNEVFDLFDRGRAQLEKYAATGDQLEKFSQNCRPIDRETLEILRPQFQALSDAAKAAERDYRETSSLFEKKLVEYYNAKGNLAELARSLFVHPFDRFAFTRNFYIAHVIPRQRTRHQSNEVD